MSLSYASEKKSRDHSAELPEHDLMGATPTLYKSNQLAEKYVNSSAFTDDLASLPHKERTVTADLGDKLRSRFGTDMTGVRIFEDEGLKEQFNQRAYAKGNEIHINKGEFSPETSSGEELLMHEAGHVIQQGSGMVSSSGVVENPSLESGADNISAPANFSMPTADASSAIQGWNPWKTIKGFGASIVHNHQRAVDAINNNFDDYKKMGKWDRFKWTMANPLARMFHGAERSGTEERNRQQHLEEQGLSNAEALNLYKNEEGSDTNLFGGFKEATEEPDPFASQYTRDNIRKTQAKNEQISKDYGLSKKLGYGSLGSSLLSVGVGLKAKDGFSMLEDGKMPSVADMSRNGAAGIVSSVGSALSLAQNFNNARMAMDNGDKTKKRQSFVSAAGDTASMLGSTIKSGINIASAATKTTNALPALDSQFVPAMDIFAGGAKVAKGAIGLHSARKTYNAMEDRLKGLSDTKENERMRKIYNQFKDEAHVRKWQSGLDIGSGALKATGGALKMSGVGSIYGSIVGGVGTGLDIANTLYGMGKRKEQRTALVNDELGLDKKIADYIEAYKKSGVDVDEKTAKHIILKSMGYKSGKRKEAFQNITMNRAAFIKDRLDNGDEELANDLDLETGKDGKYSLQTISEKLGMDSDKSWVDQMKETLESSEEKNKKRNNPFNNN